MNTIIYDTSTPEDNRFETISDFEDCMIRGGEVEFIWKNIHYGAIRYGTDDKITLYVANKPETEQVYDTPDDALEYIVGGDRLRDVITQVTVLFRSV